MKVYLNKITGIDDAIVSMMMSKRTWTREMDLHIRELTYKNTTREGFLLNDLDEEFINYLNKVIKYGVNYGHTTLLRFIDLSFVTEGLHRAAQDDFDAHAKRLDNRIVRSSTRLGTYTGGEKSDYYKDKILYTDELCKLLGIKLPSFADINGKRYIKTEFGYVEESQFEIQDVKRGLYTMAIPSNFIWKSQYPELCHIFQHRDEDSHAHPELQFMMTKIRDELNIKFNVLAENLENVKMQKKHKNNK